MKKDNRRTVAIPARLFDMGKKTSELTRKMRDRSSDPANAIPELTGDEEGVMLTIKRDKDATFL